MAVLMLVSGCGEESPREAAHDVPNSAPKAAHKTAWLDMKSPLAPAQWIASRDNDHVLSPDDPKVREIAANLKIAHRLYRESERMIANRAVQLSEMLKARGITEDAADILADLTHIAGEAGQTEGFGAVVQMYHNLRSADVERTAALATLKTRYGPRGEGRAQ